MDRIPFPAARIGALAIDPLRRTGQQLRERLGLHRELSVVAVRG